MREPFASPEEEREADALIRQAVNESEVHQAQFRSFKSLTPLKTPPKPMRFITADFECEPWDGSIRRQVTWFDGQKVHETTEDRNAERQFLTWLRDDPGYQGQTVYMHNLNYDGLFILEGATKFKMRWNPLYRNRLIALDVDLGIPKGMPSDAPHKHARFSDSFALTFASLAKLTKEFDVEHKKLKDMPGGTHCNVHPFSCPHAKFFNPFYRANDVQGLYEVLDKMGRILGGDVSLTLAATAMSIFRRHYLDTDVWRNKKLLDVQRRAYYGARTEVFRFNFERDREFYYYDVNSLYPSVMRDLEVPIGELRRGQNDIESAGFSYAKVSEDTHFPSLPIRGGKLFFTKGVKTGWFTNDELRYVRERGSKIHVYESFVCDETAPIFSRYVDDIYHRRLDAKKAGNTALAFVNKLLLNSLYGKMGQKQQADEFVIDETGVPQGGIPMNASESVWKVPKESDSQHIIPLIGAMVTAAARLRMARELDRIDPDSVYMSDTDSLVLDRPALKASDRLGDFKLEGRIHDFFVFAPKVYFYRDEEGHTSLKMKGVSAKSGEDELSFKERLSNAVDFVSGKPVENRAGILSLVSALKASDGVRFAYSRSLTRSFAGSFDKRLVLPDGRTVPHEWNRPFVPQTFPNPGYPDVLEAVRRSFVKAYADPKELQKIVSP